MKKLVLVISFLIILCSCNPTRNISYFQDAMQVDDTPAPVSQAIRLVPGDRIQFMVYVTGNPALTRLFYINNPYSYEALYESVVIGTSSASQNNYFIIDDKGYLDLPVIGKVKAAGLKRSELEQLVRQKIIDNGYGNEVTVTATHMNAGVTLVGEVNRPGRCSINHDQFTVLEALAMGNDLTVNARRDNIIVVRNIDGIDNVYQMDLRSLKDVVNSPAYYLQNNDVVYVQPSKKRIRESVNSGNDIYTSAFWLQLTTLEIRILRLLDKLNK